MWYFLGGEGTLFGIRSEFEKLPCHLGLERMFVRFFELTCMIRGLMERRCVLMSGLKMHDLTNPYQHP